MDLGSIFLILALFALVTMFISRPFFDQRRRNREATSHLNQQESALLAERDRVLNALTELDFDYSTGKIPEEDYPSQRTILLQSGAEALRKLDELRGVIGAQVETESAETRLEAAIAARRLVLAPAGGAGPKEADEDLEVRIADRRRARNEKSAGFCPQCGSPLQRSDRFCPRCGHKLPRSK